MKYDFEKQKYSLDSHSLKTLYEHSTQAYPSLIEYLNREQAFRIIPATSNTIYVNGNFYKPFDNYGQQLNPDELDFFYSLEAIEELSNIGQEKGSGPFEENEAWPANTLFNFIDTLGRNTKAEDLFGDPDIVVCDDMNNEIADFIIADTTKQRVVFIHAKASSSPSFVSASKLHEVCAQALKNLGYISAFQIEKPNQSIRKWNNPWDGGRSRVINERIRRGDGDGEQIWNNISSILKNPNAEREVWLVMGQSLSKQIFYDALSKRNTPPYAIQAAYLLKSTLSSISTLGGKFRVLCSE